MQRLEAAGFAGYDDLIASSIDFEIFGVRAHVASSRDIVRTKEAANRAKDQAALPVLYAVEDEIAAAELEGRMPG